MNHGENESDDEAGVCDIEVWPVIGTEHDQNPVSDGVDGFSGLVNRDVVHPGDKVRLPDQVMKAESVEGISQSAAGEEGADEGEGKAFCCAGTKEPEGDHGEGEKRREREKP